MSPQFALTHASKRMCHCLTVVSMTLDSSMQNYMVKAVHIVEILIALQQALSPVFNCQILVNKIHTYEVMPSKATNFGRPCTYSNKQWSNLHIYHEKL